MIDLSAQGSTFSSPCFGNSRRWQNMRIGLLGGSFNPPHAGHLHIARRARIQLGLDFIWWIITPQNPLKKIIGMAPYMERYNAVEKMVEPYPFQIPTHLEAQMETQYTYQTVTQLRQSFPKTDFIWLCGMDNAHIFHKWDHWQDILLTLPLAFISRPPATSLVKNCPVKMVANIPHYYAPQGRKTDLKHPGIYWLTDNKMLNISSTKIRKSNKINSL